MGGSSDWTIDYVNAPEIAAKAPETLQSHELLELTGCTPFMLAEVLKHAVEAENLEMVATIGTIALQAAQISRIEQSLKRDPRTRHTTYKPHEYLRVAKDVFPSLEAEYERSQQHAALPTVPERRMRIAGVPRKLGQFASDRLAKLSAK